jgi:hypothetical protein
MPVVVSLLYLVSVGWKIRKRVLGNQDSLAAIDIPATR